MINMPHHLDVMRVQAFAGYQLGSFSHLIKPILYIRLIANSLTMFSEFILDIKLRYGSSSRNNKKGGQKTALIVCSTAMAALL